MTKHSKEGVIVHQIVLQLACVHTLAETLHVHAVLDPNVLPVCLVSCIVLCFIGFQEDIVHRLSVAVCYLFPYSEERAC